MAAIVDPTEYKAKDWYRGSTGLKRTGVKTIFTKDMVSEAQRCANDIAYFCANYVWITDIDKGVTKFKAREYQEEFWDIIQKNRFVISRMGRQSGKTTSIVGYLLHYAIFNKGKTIGITAQNISQAREIIHRFKLAYENIPSWLQVGVVEWQKGSVNLGNGTRIFASSSNGDALRGQALSLLILDEFAHIRGDKEFMTATFPVVSSGEKSKIIIISTPNGVGNAFYDIWKGSETKTNQFVNYFVDWKRIPRAGYEGRIEEWAKSTIADVGQRRFNQEYAAEFLGSSNTLIDALKLENMRNVAQESISTDEEYKVSVFKEPVEGRSYVMTVDVGRGYGGDYSTFSIFDVTQKPFEQVCVFRDNMISTKLFPYLIHRYARKYNEAFVVIERNDAGGEVANILYFDIEYTEMYIETGSNGTKPGLWTSKSVKRTGCSNLRDIIESDGMIINCKNTLKEFTTFEGNKQGIYNATKNNNDDMVQNCWLFAYSIDTPYLSYFKEGIQTTSDVAHRQQIEKLIEDLPPIGVFSNNNQQTVQQRDAMLKKLMGEEKSYDLHIG